MERVVYSWKIEYVMAPWNGVCNYCEKRWYGNQRASLSLLILPSPPPKWSLCHSTTQNHSARNTDIIPVNTNTNVFMFINNYFTYYHMFQVSLAPHPNQTFLPLMIICNWQLSSVKLWKHNITTLLHNTTIVVICSKSMCGEGKFKKAWCLPIHIMFSLQICRFRPWTLNCYIMCTRDTEANPSCSFSNVINMCGNKENVVQVKIWNTLYLLGYLNPSTWGIL